MKLFLIVIICFSKAVFSVREYQLDRDYFKQQVAVVRSLGSSEEAVFLLAELYNYVNGALSITEEDLTTKNVFLIILDNAVYSIAIQDGYIFSNLLQSLTTSGEHFVDLINRWRNEFGQSNNLVEPYERIEEFMRQSIALIIDEPKKSPAALINALSNGSGLCNIFYFQFVMQNGASDTNVKFAKLAYLLRELELRRLDTWLGNQDVQIFAIQKLGLACKQLAERVLSRERRKAFLLTILNKQLQTPIAQLDLYDDGSDDNICTKLASYTIDSIFNHFVDKNSIDVFVYECLDDLATRFSRAYNVPEIQMYRGSLLSHWFMRLEQFVKRNNGDRTFSNADKYLEKLVKEVPTNDARLAIERGEGLCGIIDDKEFKAIGDHYEHIVDLCYAFQYDFLPSEGLDLSELVRFQFFRTVCLRQRQVLLLKHDNNKKVMILENHGVS